MLRAVIVLALLGGAVAHMSMWHPAVYDQEPKNKDSNLNSNPLAAMTFNEWWWHGNLNFPPPKGTVFSLPANGAADAWLSTNRAFTPFGYPERVDPNPRQAPNPWEGSFFTKVDNTHAPHREDVAGCAMGIAYKSDPRSVRPEDFVIFSVVHDCPARFQQAFQIPNLPACPTGGCQCAWFWIHKSIGGTDQMYMTPFVCNVTNSRADAKPVDVARARAPRKCHNPAHCTQGPRNPMYWMNTERNNMAEDYTFAPTYSILYGFAEGAQKDIFVNTNPVNDSPKPFSQEQKCTSAVNTKKAGSRLTSQTSTSSISSATGDILMSPNCQWRAWIQGDGNLIVGSTVQDGEVLWTCSCNNKANGTSFTFALEPTGLLSVKSNTGKQTWASKMTAGVGKAPYILELTNDGVLVLFDSTGADIWESWYFDRREEKSLSPFTADPSVWKRM